MIYWIDVSILDYVHLLENKGIHWSESRADIWSLNNWSDTMRDDYLVQ